LDRKLSKPADFERFQGSRVKLTTRDPVNGNRHFEGRLERFEAGRLTLDIARPSKKPKQKPEPPHILDIELANVEKANLVPEI
jgi:ribosome maturation factor RimP